MPQRAKLRLSLTLGLALGVTPFLGACGGPKEPPLTAPRKIVAPYDVSRGEVLWAVVPLRNESGTSLVDIGAVSDKVVAAAEEVEGVRCVPLNRTIQAMNVLGYTSLRSPAEARSLAQAMGVDGVLVGSVTAYDPYVPTLGLALALYARPGSMAPGREPLDPRTLATKGTDAPAMTWSRDEGPVAVISQHLDAKNHQVQMDVRSFAQGRLKGPTALGWRRYLASMDLYCEFGAYHAVDELIQQEWVRLPGAGQTEKRSAEAPER
ncbi:MAG TPA: hypothetical protein VD997_03240 [Phycisphaerales bacterium]|nr:hypothetical protein [Phycisphaerales bacterium]